LLEEPHKQAEYLAAPTNAATCTVNCRYAMTHFFEVDNLIGSHQHGQRRR
jgi:hypothetical protein